ncbi:TIGR03936 family radical SAM-associated protein [Fervidobacterium thailandense]|uniref:TIGR03936 family radical SAM-associated protein n=1 Tax=Fervidobacterium thailandense TaxID=1008305 RepID=UPI001F4E435A|nr:TIGR03936 family radical SAM-associated protein [Fervidobacterium thailandense]
MQIVLQFKKTGFLRFLSGIETSNAIVKLLRRANLPMEYSQGFNPQPKVSFLDSAPTGVIDLALFVGVKLREPVPQEFAEFDTETIKRRINDVSLKNLSLERVFVSDIDLNKAATHFEYTLICREKPNLAERLRKHSGKEFVPMEVVEDLQIILKGKLYVVKYKVGRSNLFNPYLVHGVFLAIRRRAFAGGKDLVEVLGESANQLRSDAVGSHNIRRDKA